MTIKDFENRIFKGSSFNKWTYDDTQPLEELKKKWIPLFNGLFCNQYN